MMNQKEMLRSLVQTYFNTLSRYWEESGKVPVAAKENISYEEDTEDLIDYFLTSVLFAWRNRGILQDDFVATADCSMIVRFYKGLKDREVDWDTVWDRLIEAVEIGEEIFDKL